MTTTRTATIASHNKMADALVRFVREAGKESK